MSCFVFTIPKIRLYHLHLFRLPSHRFFLFAMKLFSHGQSSFSIESEKTTIAINPTSSSTASVTLITSPLFASSGSQKACDWPGEYEVSGVPVMGISSTGTAQEENTVFRFSVEGISICHLGNIAPSPSPEFIEQLGNVDILLLPVGEIGKSLAPKEAKDLLERIEPRICVPFSDDEMSLSRFFQEMGAHPEQKSALELKKSELPVESLQLVWLTRA